jgi:hypothetical protein
MRVYQMTDEQLHKGSAEAMKLARRLARSQPEVSDLLMDAAELALKEMLVHLFKGDREAAEKMHKQVNSRHKD